MGNLKTLPNVPDATCSPGPQVQPGELPIAGSGGSQLDGG